MAKATKKVEKAKKTKKTVVRVCKDCGQKAKSCQCSASPMNSVAPMIGLGLGLGMMGLMFDD